MKIDTIHNINPKCIICDKKSKRMIVKIERNIYICINCAVEKGTGLEVTLTEAQSNSKCDDQVKEHKKSSLVQIG